jgi:hypothetical protein
LSPATLRSVYSLPSTGGGGTIAIVDAYHYATAENDLNVFSTALGLPKCTVANGCFKQVYASGSKPRANCGWAQEAALDIEWAHAMAPNAKIVLVEAATNRFANFVCRGGRRDSTSHGERRPRPGLDELERKRIFNGGLKRFSFSEQQRGLYCVERRHKWSERLPQRIALRGFGGRHECEAECQWFTEQRNRMERQRRRTQQIRASLRLAIGIAKCRPDAPFGAGFFVRR